MSTEGVHDRLTFSIIVASRKRPDWLDRCLTALLQLDHPAFEVIVVADGETLARLSDREMPIGVRLIRFDEPNLSKARNRGIAVASGQACAFIDDDAVPEPLWLRHHENALVATGAHASVGYVRGRNGISFQSQAAWIDGEAETHVVALSGDDPVVLQPPAGQALKLVGTNCVVRRDVLLDLGGFDPAFRFFLEDSDLSLRLAARGFNAAIVPLAEVHHGFAASFRRSALRAPRDLFDIGRSSAVFFRRHSQPDLPELFRRVEARERVRMLRHMIQGTCEPRDLGEVLGSLRAGWDEGLSVELSDLVLEIEAKESFEPVVPLQRGHHVMTSRLLRRRSRLREAQVQVGRGRRVSLFSFSLTPVRHHVRFTNEGVWLQTGGQFGRADRALRRIRWCRFAERAKEEGRRVANQRGIEES